MVLEPDCPGLKPWSHPPPMGDPKPVTKPLGLPLTHQCRDGHPEQCPAHREGLRVWATVMFVIVYPMVKTGKSPETHGGREMASEQTTPPFSGWKEINLQSERGKNMTEASGPRLCAREDRTLCRTLKSPGQDATLGDTKSKHKCTTIFSQPSTCHSFGDKFL